MKTIWRSSPWLVVIVLVLIAWKFPPLLPWILLAATLFMCWFIPRRGLIGPICLPANDAFLPAKKVQSVHSAIGDYVLDIDLQSTKAPALHYGGDAHPYIFGGYTNYGSRTHMATAGTLSIAGKSCKVTGTSWFDRQYGELFQAIKQG